MNILNVIYNQAQNYNLLFEKIDIGDENGDLIMNVVKTKYMLLSNNELEIPKKVQFGM